MSELCAIVNSHLKLKVFILMNPIGGPWTCPATEGPKAKHFSCIDSLASMPRFRLRATRNVDESKTKFRRTHLEEHQALPPDRFARRIKREIPLSPQPPAHSCPFGRFQPDAVTASQQCSSPPTGPQCYVLSQHAFGIPARFATDPSRCCTPKR